MANKLIAPNEIQSDLYDIDSFRYLMDHPHVLGHLCGYEDLTELHSMWIKYSFDHNFHTTLMAHRGSFKTSGMEVGVVRHLILHPNARIMYLRRKFDTAESNTDTIVNKLMNKPEIVELFRFAHGSVPKLLKKRKDGYDFNFHTKAAREPSLFPKGCEGSLIGTHCTKVIADDVVDIRSRISKAERTRIEIIMRDVYTSIIDRGYGVSLVGTRYHAEDYFSVAPKGPSYNCFETGLMTSEQIEKARANESKIGFAAQYMLNIEKPEGAEFAEVKEIDWMQVGNYRVKAHIDSAFGGGDFCALTLMAERPDGKLQLIGFVYDGSIVNWIPFVVQTLQLYHCRTIYVESNTDRGWTANMLKEKGLFVQTYSETTNKEAKISTYLGEVWHKLYIDTKLSDEKYVSMMSEWEPTSKNNDDSPDSAASLIRAEFSSTKGSILALWG